MKKEEVDKIYNELKELYTDEEIAESFVFSYDMTDDDRKLLSKAIKERRRTLTKEEREEISNFIKKNNMC